jgi:putative ABC transport system permease protein
MLHTDYTAYRGVIANTILIISGLAIFLSLSWRVNEKPYELALLRTLGCSRRDLFMLVIWEGTVIAVAGYIIGLLLSHITLLLVHHKTPAFAEELYQPGFVLLVSVVFAVAPAIKASRINVPATIH